ncbi:putative Uncharacterized protein family UPF0029 [Trypanosoma vivax]|uniref:Impact N-terminal domain-containing protein n=1 Tax=Trypanosoma vivax (strain Y486) TaxID=1055687 RepID=G0UD01_TRYVY|nr:hypothetical protein TRVL_06616 [Trypanosoma vivax]KAH8608196.1 putative Uncharacterized protein family UPF0029 [Trypanosoma vivax]CCC53711.1 conserved hypothetical protein [Trypanosoma vivax Y486]
MEGEVAEEIDMLLSAFADEVRLDDAKRPAVIVSLPFRFTLHITIPAHGYPDAVMPSLFVAEGPNSPLTSEFSSRLSRLVRSEVVLGAPMLMHIITLAQGLALEMQESHEAKLQAVERERVEGEEAMALESDRQLQSAVEVMSGAPIVDRKSKFVAHMARVDSEARVHEVVMYLRMQKHIAEATHPTIYAYRFTDSSGILHADCDDDGEAGAASRILFLMEQLKVDGYVLVVTRWFGGILLGPDRFKHIMEVARQMLLTIPQVVKKG